MVPKQPCHPSVPPSLPFQLLPELIGHLHQPEAVSQRGSILDGSQGTLGGEGGMKGGDMLGTLLHPLGTVPGDAELSMQGSISWRWWRGGQWCASTGGELCGTGAGRHHMSP